MWNKPSVKDCVLFIYLFIWLLFVLPNTQFLEILGVAHKGPKNINEDIFKQWPCCVEMCPTKSFTTLAAQTGQVCIPPPPHRHSQAPALEIAEP